MTRVRPVLAAGLLALVAGGPAVSLAAPTTNHGAPRARVIEPAPLPTEAKPSASGASRVRVQTAKADERLVESWMGLGKVPAEIAGGGSKNTTVVLADELELGGQVYSHAQATAPRHLILIADTLHLSGPVSFDLSGPAKHPRTRIRLSREERGGGDLTVIARRLVCEANGKLDFRSAGDKGIDVIVHDQRDHRGKKGGRRTYVTTKPRTSASGGQVQKAKRVDRGQVQKAKRVERDRRRRKVPPPRGGTVPKPRRPPTGNGLPPPRREPSASPAYGGGHGGHLRLAAERFLIGGEEVTAQEIFDRGCVTWTNPGGAGGKRSPAGEAGSVTAFEQPRDVLPALGENGGVAFSKWVLANLQRAAIRVREADLGDRRSEAIRELGRVFKLADTRRYPVLSEDISLYEERLIQLQELKDRLGEALWQRPAMVPTASGVPRRVELFTEVSDLRTRVAPTEALIRGRAVDGRQVVGLIEFDPDRPQALRLELDAELTVDPWLAADLGRSLELADDDFAGAFHHWNLRGRPILGPGILDSTVDVDSSARGVRVSLTVEVERLPLVMARLASSAGLPLVFDWEHQKDRNITGTWDGPALTLQRRSAVPLVLEGDGRVRHHGDVELTLEYAGARETGYFPVAQTLKPGDSVDLPGLGGDSGGAGIPPEAVAWSGTDPFRLMDDFHILNGEGLVETITVTNLLGFDAERGGVLEHVEVDLVYRVLDADGLPGQEIDAGPYALSAEGSLGSRVEVSFLKPARGRRQVVLSGTARYEGQSQATLIESTFDDLTIAITDTLLPPLGEAQAAP